MTEEQYEARRKELADAFKKAMKAKGTKQVGLAEQLDLKVATVNQDISRNNISFKKLLMYCEALDLEVIIQPKQ